MQVTSATRRLDQVSELFHPSQHQSLSSGAECSTDSKLSSTILAIALKMASIPSYQRIVFTWRDIGYEDTMH
ncbi:MAG: hypothetical protein ACLUHA_07675 [Bacteroides stercoris]